MAPLSTFSTLFPAYPPLKAQLLNATPPIIAAASADDDHGNRSDNDNDVTRINYNAINTIMKVTSRRDFKRNHAPLSGVTWRAPHHFCICVSFVVAPLLSLFKCITVMTSNCNHNEINDNHDQTVTASASGEANSRRGRRRRRCHMRKVVPLSTKSKGPIKRVKGRVVVEPVYFCRCLRVCVCVCCVCGVHESGVYGFCTESIGYSTCRSPDTVLC